MEIKRILYTPLLHARVKVVKMAQLIRPLRPELNFCSDAAERQDFVQILGHMLLYHFKITKVQCWATYLQNVMDYTLLIESNKLS